MWPDDPERGQLTLAECEPDQRCRLGSLKEDAQPGPPQQEKSSLTGRTAASPIFFLIPGSALTPLLFPRREGLGLHSKGWQPINSCGCRAAGHCPRGSSFSLCFQLCCSLEPLRKSCVVWESWQERGHETFPGEDHPFAQSVCFPTNVYTLHLSVSSNVNASLPCLFFVLGFSLE